MTDFAKVDPGATPILSMDFSLRLASGDTIASATWTVEDDQGTAQPAMLSGAIDITAAPIVRQKVTGWTDGKRYLHRCKVTTAAGVIIYGDVYQWAGKGA
jgi:hypothetical protein